IPNVGVKVSGLIVDAGPVNSPVLVSVGHPGQARQAAQDPDTIQDVFFRIGGAETTNTSATVSLLDNASSSIIDDVWAWRADHGNDVGWTENVGDNGLVVTGDDVTAYGLAVEHYQKSEVVWTGQGGTDVFFQNELPYDPPSQAAWNQSATELGYPAFEVGNNVKTFNGYAMGSYVVFIDTTATLNVSQAFESPDTPGVQFHNVFGVWIAGSGGLNSVVNGVGGPVTSTNPGTVVPVDVTSYP
ncbi:MAG: coagulation factor 5/8 type domain protein, partial [Actinomycetia bacterium]|nr:coagulation factor 5/8 type domain protein [Actinomycetes bacterium]